MGKYKNRRCTKFYESQLNDIEEGLVNLFDNSSAKMSKDQYLLLMEQLGQDPNPEEIPLEFSDFPYEVQEAIKIFSILPDIYEGMSGTYMGKDYTILPYLMDEIFKVENKQETMMYLVMINKIVTDIRQKEQQRKQKQAERKSKRVNVKG